MSVGDNQVWISVAIEVARSRETGNRSGIKAEGWTEGSVAIAKQQRHIPMPRPSKYWSLIGNRQIGFAVSVEVGHSHGDGFGSHIVVNRSLECAVAPTQGYRDIV